MPRELPILCAGPVVRAILSGAQTQDRRPIKALASLDDGRPSYPQYHIRRVVTADNTYPKAVRGRSVLDVNNGDGARFYDPAPWSPGDTIYVRETWRPYIRGWSSHVQYQAGNETRPDRPVVGASLGPDESDAAMEWLAERGGVLEIECRDPATIRWFPSIHMPKWAARIHLRVLSVGVERVNEISEADAEAEGVPRNWADGLPGWTPTEGWLTQEGLDNANRGHDCDDAGMVGGKMAIAATARDAFRSLWNRLYPALSFDSSPWVWVTTFERVKP